MIRSLCCCAALLILMAAATVPVTAQSPFPDAAPPDDAAPPVGTPKKNAAPQGPAIAGNWGGELTQVGKDAPYKFELAIGAKGLATKYPDLSCTGKLTRAGSSKSYAFFVEVITQGRFDKGGRCPDGTLTVARQGDNLSLSWFASVQGISIVAYGLLSKK